MTNPTQREQLDQVLNDLDSLREEIEQNNDGSLSPGFTENITDAIEALSGDDEGEEGDEEEEDEEEGDKAKAETSA